MSKVLVLYYSACGHVEKMAETVAEGAAQFQALRSSSSVSPNGAGGSRQKIRHEAGRSHL
jgi:hypothetical protein